MPRFLKICLWILLLSAGALAHFIYSTYFSSGINQQTMEAALVLIVDEQLNSWCRTIFTVLGGGGFAYFLLVKRLRFFDTKDAREREAWERFVGSAFKELKDHMENRLKPHLDAALNTNHKKHGNHKAELVKATQDARSIFLRLTEDMETLPKLAVSGNVTIAMQVQKIHALAKALRLTERTNPVNIGNPQIETLVKPLVEIVETLPDP